MTTTTVSVREVVTLHGRFAKLPSGAVIVAVPTHVLSLSPDVREPRLVQVSPKAAWYAEGQNDWNAVLLQAVQGATLHLWNQRRRNRVVRHNVALKETQAGVQPTPIDFTLEPGRHWDVSVTTPNEQKEMFPDTFRIVEIELTVAFNLAHDSAGGMETWVQKGPRRVRCRKKATKD